MKYFLSTAALCAFVASAPAIAQETVTGAPKGTAPATIEGYGPSSAIVCNGSGECWHSVKRYDYPQGVQLDVHPFDWTGTTARSMLGGNTRAGDIGRTASGKSSKREASLAGRPSGDSAVVLFLRNNPPPVVLKDRIAEFAQPWRPNQPASSYFYARGFFA